MLERESTLEDFKGVRAEWEKKYAKSNYSDAEASKMMKLYGKIVKTIENSLHQQIIDIVEMLKGDMETCGIELANNISNQVEYEAQIVILTHVIKKLCDKNFVPEKPKEGEKANPIFITKAEESEESCGKIFNSGGVDYKCGENNIYCGGCVNGRKN